MAGLIITFRSQLADMMFRRKLLHTLSIYFCFTAVGFNVSQTGPALLDLQLITSTNTQQASVFITGASVGSMIGSLSMGFIYERWRNGFTLSLTLLGAAVTVIALPWCSSYVLMIVMHGLVSMFRSAFSTAVTVDVIRTWAPNSRVPLQLLNAFFSVGGTLAPLITEPFLAPKAQGNTTTESVNISTLHSHLMKCGDLLNEEHETNHSTFDNFTDSQETPSTHVQLAYLIPGVWFLVGSFIFIIHGSSLKEERTTTSSENYESLEKPLPIPIFIASTILVCLMFFFQVSVNTSLSAYLPTFVVMYLDWSKSSSANISMVFWLCIASGRFVAISYTRVVSPLQLILLSSCIALIATIGNVVFSLYHYDIGVWICTGIIGACISSQVPSLMMLTEESIMRLTPRIMSVFNFSITFPGMVIPQILGYLMQEISPLWLFYLNLIQWCVYIVLLLLAYLWAKMVIHPTHKHLNRSYAWKGDLAESDEYQT